MDWIDYREKLGLGFDDEGKVRLFYTRIFNVLSGLSNSGEIEVTPEEYFAFCDETGSNIQTPLMAAYRGADRFRDCVAIIKDHERLFADCLSYFVWFINCIGNQEGRLWNKTQYKLLLTRCLKETHIQYELGYKNHSAVLKRVRKIAERWTEYMNEIKP